MSSPSMSPPWNHLLSSPTQRAGLAAEQVALDYLLSRGLRPIARNYRVKLGELDLVMAQGGELVFVEVRRRAGDAFGGAAASVTASKRARVRRAAQAFLAERYGDRRWPPVRFDVVAIEGDRLHWIAGAF